MKKTFSIFGVVFLLLGGFLAPNTAFAGTFTCSIHDPSTDYMTVSDWDTVGVDTLYICYSWLGYACDSTSSAPDVRDLEYWAHAYSAPSGLSTIRYTDSYGNYDFQWDEDTDTLSDPNDHCAGAPPAADPPLMLGVASSTPFASNTVKSIAFVLAAAMGIYFVIKLFSVGKAG